MSRVRMITFCNVHIPTMDSGVMESVMSQLSAVNSRLSQAPMKLFLYSLCRLISLQVLANNTFR